MHYNYFSGLFHCRGYRAFNYIINLYSKFVFENDFTRTKLEQ